MIMIIIMKMLIGMMIIIIGMMIIIIGMMIIIIASSLSSLADVPLLKHWRWPFKLLRMIFLHNFILFVIDRHNYNITLGGGVNQDPQKCLRNIWMTPDDIMVEQNMNLIPNVVKIWIIVSLVTPLLTVIDKQHMREREMLHFGFCILLFLFH